MSHRKNQLSHCHTVTTRPRYGGWKTSSHESDGFFHFFLVHSENYVFLHLYIYDNNLAWKRLTLQKP